MQHSHCSCAVSGTGSGNFSPAASACLCLCRLGQVLVYSKIRAALGISRAVVSGGGSLPPALDDWYEAIGLPVLNGWGLTEVGHSDMLEPARDEAD